MKRRLEQSGAVFGMNRPFVGLSGKPRGMRLGLLQIRGARPIGAWGAMQKQSGEVATQHSIGDDLEHYAR